MWSVMMLSALGVASESFESTQQNDWLEEGFDFDTVDEFVVGGEQASRGAWPDAAGIVTSGYVSCTGTLIAPKVVLTAAHCVESRVTAVVLNRNDYTDSSQGEVIEVVEAIPHPKYGSAYGGYDIAVLRLATRATVEPRPVALDCVVDDLVRKNDDVAIVGYGAINTAGNRGTSKLMEGFHYITNKNCNTTQKGCAPETMPGGEIIAGGDGTGACFGDSGGPLYWLGANEGIEQDYLIGVTSRAAFGNSTSCGGDAIWVRPDYFINFIENRGGKDIPHPQCNGNPDVIVEPIVTDEDQEGTTQVVVVDDGDSFTVEVLEGPEHGELIVGDDGELRFVPDEGFDGEDSAVVLVTDDGSEYEASPPISVELDLPITVRNVKGQAEGCACSSSPQSSSLWTVFALPLGATVLRRRQS